MNIRIYAILLTISCSLGLTTAFAQAPTPGDPGTCFVIADEGNTPNAPGSGTQTPDTLYVIDRITGLATLIGSTGTTNSEVLAFEVINQVLYTMEGGTLLTLDYTGSGTATVVNAANPGPHIGTGSVGNVTFDDLDGLTFDYSVSPPVLYATQRIDSPDADLLVQIDVATGLIVPGGFSGGTADYVEIGTTATEDNIDDIAEDCRTGILYGILNNSDNGTEDVLVEIDKSSGAITIVTNTGVFDMEGLAFGGDGVLFGSTGNNGDAPLTANSSYDLGSPGDVNFGVATNGIRVIDTNGVAIGFDFEGLACFVPAPLVDVEIEISGESTPCDCTSEAQITVIAGSVTLNNVVISNDVLSDCDTLIPVLLPGQIFTITCSIAGTISNTVSVSAEDCFGRATNDFDTAILSPPTDTTPPIFVNVPGSLTIDCGDPLPPEDVVIADNCTDPDDIAVGVKTTLICPGEAERIWTAFDFCGNSASATQRLFISDYSIDLIGDPTNLNLSCTDPIPGATVTLTQNCSVTDLAMPGTNVTTNIFINTSSTPVSFNYAITDEGNFGGVGNGDDIADALILIDPITGEGQYLGETGTFDVEAMAINPEDGTIYAFEGGDLFVIQPDNVGLASNVGPAGSGSGTLGTVVFDNLDGADFDTFVDPPVLYATQRRAGNDLLVRIDPATGSIVSNAFAGNDYVVISTLGALNNVDDIAIDPDTGIMYGIFNDDDNLTSDELATINKVNGLVTDVSTNSIGVFDVEGLDFDCNGFLRGTTGNNGDAPVTANSILNLGKPGTPGFGSATTVTRVNDGGTPTGYDFEAFASFCQIVDNVTTVTVVTTNIVIHEITNNLTLVFTSTTNTSGNGCTTIIERVWTGSDACSNTVSATQSITIVDDVPPIMSVPTNITIVCDPVPPPPTVTATDLCSMVDIDFSSTNLPCANCPYTYIIQRVWTATDACGNSTTGTQLVTVTVCGSIGSTVFLDEDGDGTQGATEPGIAGVLVEIVDTNNMVVGSDTTDSNGFYLVTDIAVGTYTVRITTPPAGSLASSPGAGGDDQVDGDDNGNQPGGAGTTVTSAPITLSDDGEPTGGAESGTGGTLDDLLDDNNGDMTVDFGFVPDPVSIGSTVFLDEDGDGMQDATEPGIAGVLVEVLDASNVVVGSDTTDSNGFYHVTNLVQGTYTVRITTPPAGSLTSSPGAGGDDQVDGDDNGNQPGGTGTTVTSDPITLTNQGEPTGEAGTGGTLDAADDNNGDMTVDFGFVPDPVSIGSTVFLDEDGDGMQDATEPGIAGVLVEVLDTNGVVVGSDTTDSNGFYHVTNLVEGTYTVRITTPPAGSLASSPGAGGDDQVDGDDNGSQPGGTGTTVTSAPITLTNQGEPTGEAGTGGTLDAADDNNGDMTVDFGFVPDPVSIGSTVFLDEDGDGMQDATEPGIAGVLVEVLDASNVVVGSDTTDSNGFYHVTNLVEGTYTVRITTPPAGSLASSPGAGGDDQVDGDDNGNQPGGTGTSVVSDPITLTNQGEPTGEPGTGGTQDAADDNNGDMTVDFGFVPDPVSIGSTVFLDEDGDGMQDATEPGIAGVLVEVLDASNVVVGSDTTDSNGFYHVTNLVEGTYTVRITTPPAGSIASSPGAGGDDQVDGDDNGNQPGGTGTTVTSDPITLTNQGEPTGEAGTGGTLDAADDNNGDMTVDFGFVPDPLSIGSTVFLDEDGDSMQDATEPGIAGVLVEVLDTNNLVVGSDTTDSNGFYHVTNLVEGTYTVRITTPPAGSLASSPGAGGDDQVDGDDNGNQAGGTGTSVVSDPITLTNDGEPAGGAEAGTGGTLDDLLDDNNGDMTVDFGFVPDPVSIGSTVFLDEDGDGMQDATEPGIAGVLVEVLDASNVVVGSDTTDSNGFYHVTNLVEGTYTVRITTPPAGSLASSPGAGGDDQVDGDDNGNQPGGTGTTVTSDPITLTNQGEPTGEAGTGGTLDAADDNNGDMTVDFGFVPDPVSIGSTVFLDENGDGMQDTNEVGIAGVLVEVLDSTLNVVGFDITDSNGFYHVTNLAAGTYSVRITTPPLGSLASSPGAGGDDQVDGDDNGIQTGGPGTTVQSQPITLTNNGEPTGTNEFGTGGTLDAADDNNGDMTVDFGFVPDPEMSIGSTVFLDEDGDGIQDATEPGIAGVLVEVEDVNGVLVGSAITDTNGDYFVGGLDEGIYFVRIPTPPTGAGASSPGNGVDDQVDGDDNGLQPGGAGTVVQSEPITLTANTEPTGTNEFGSGGTQDDADDANGDMTVDFGFVPDPEMSIGSTVFLDEDGDGIQDATEPGIAGVLVEVEDANGVLVGSAITDTNGDYFVGGLDEGIYLVRIPSPPAGAGASSPTNGVDDQVDGDDNGLQPGGPGTVVQSEPITLTANTEPTGTNEFGSGGTQDDADDANGDMTVDFGFVPDPTVSIGSTVFLDENDNGIQDPTEPGIAGVLVEVVDPSGVLAGSSITDTNGDYFVGGLDEGSYVVRILTPPTGAATSSTSTNGADNQVDGDDNGIQSGGAGAPVESVLITLTDNDEPTGTNEFGSGGTQDDVDDNNGDMTVDFGFVPDPLSIGSTVFLDEDGDGTQDSNEPGISNVLVEVVDANGLVVGSDTTDANGLYFVTDLAAGVYIVRITTPPPGAAESSPGAGGDDQVDGDDNGLQTNGPGTVVESLPITLADGTEPTGFFESGPGGLQDDADDDNGDMTVDFGFVPDPLSIGSTVFLDEDRDGNQGSNEVGIAGVLVEVVDANGLVVGSDTTDSNGNYFVTDLAAGTYIVRIPTPPQEYVESSPGAGGDDQVDGDDNGLQTNGPGTAVESLPITLTDGGEPTGTNEFGPGGTQDDADDDNGDMTVDFGFLLPPEVTITKIARPLIASMGDATFDYELIVSNVSASDATSVQLIDPLPLGLTFISDTPAIGGVNAGNVYVGVLPSLAGNTSTSVFLRVRVTDTDVIEDALPTNDLTTVVIDPVTCEGITTNSLPSTNTLQNNVKVVVPIPFTSNVLIDCDTNLLALVGDFVFVDENFNGLQDGEPGVPNFEVQLLAADGTVLATTQTDTNGYYEFVVPAGTYQIQFVAPTGTAFTTANVIPGPLDSDANESTGLSGSVTLNEGDINRTIDAGIVPPEVTITKIARPLIASMGDATFDYELIVSNVSASDATSVQLIDPLPLGLTFISDTPAIGGVNAGNVYVGVLPSLAGNTSTSVFLRVRVTDTDVIEDALPTNDLTTVVIDPVTCEGITTNSLPSTNTLQNNVKVVVPIPFTSNVLIDCDTNLLALVGDFVFVDENFNGLQDGEPGVPNFEVQLLAADGTVLATTQTDADGYYEFVVPAGTYQIQFVAPTGTAFTTANVIPGPLDSDANESTGLSGSVTLNEGDINRTIDAGIVPPEVTITKLVSGALPSTTTEMFAYILIVSNTGSADAINAQVTDILPQGIRYLDDNGAGGTENAGVYQNTLALVPANTSTTLTLNVEVVNAPLIDQSLPTNDVLTVTVDPIDCTGLDANSSPSTNGLQNNAKVSVPIPFSSNVVEDCDEELVALIGDTVFLDLNSDGIQDAGDLPRSGVTVNLLDATGMTNLATKVTDGMGEYEFVVPPGTYIVEFEAPSGLAFTTQNVPGDDTRDSDADTSSGRAPPVTVAAGDIDRTIDAGLLPPDILLVKATGPATASSDDVTFSYILTVINTSASDALNVSLIDPLPMGIAYIDDDGAGGTYLSATRTYSNLLATVPANSSTTVTLHVAVTDVTVINDAVDPSDVATVPVDPITCSNLVAGTVSSNALQNTAKIELVIPDSGEVLVVCDEELLALIGDYVFVDENINGQQDADETGVPGATVNLRDANGALLASTVTDTNGYYQFVVPAGDYLVEFVAPGGTAFTTQNSGSDLSDSDADVGSGLSDPIAVGAGQIDRTIDAGLLPPQVTLTKLISEAVAGTGSEQFAYILIVSNVGPSDAVNALVFDVLPANISYLDDNGAGGSEAGGVYQNTIALIPANTSTTLVLNVMVTDSSAINQALPTNDLLVVAVDSNTCSGFTTNSLPSSNALQNNAKVTVDVPFTTNAVEDCDDEPLALIGDYVWLDVNGDGLQDSTDVALAGITVNLLDATGTTNLATKVTGASGEYEFVVPAGTYIVEFVAPSGSVFTAQDVPGDDTKDSDADPLGRTPAVTVVAGGIDRTLDAGFLVPDIDVFKTFGNTLAPVGGNYTFEYVLTITNGSVSDAINVELIDPLPLGLGYNHDGGAGGTYDAITRTYSDTLALIPANSGVSVTLSVSITNALLIAGSLPVTANYPVDPSVSCTNLSSETLSSNTLENVAQVSLTLGGSTNRTVDCDNNRLALIGDYVFTDQDLSGTQSAGDTPVPGLSVDLLGPSGTNVLATTVTDADGLYAFAVVPGTYRVRFNVPLEYDIVTQGLGGDDELDSDANPSTNLVDRGLTPTVTVGEGDVDRSLDAGIFVPALSIGSTVFLDEDRDGLQDSNEAGIPGVLVEVLDTTGGIAGFDITDSNGFYFVTDLAAGTYSVRITTPPEGSLTSSPGAGGDDQVDGDDNGLQSGGSGTPVQSVPITLTNNGEPTGSGESGPGGTQDDADDNNGDMTVDFGFVPDPPVSIGSTVFLDENDNGMQDSNEVGIAGVLVEVLDTSGVVAGSDVTDSNGDYFVEDLEEGTYSIRILTPPSGASASSTPSNGGDDQVDGDDNGLQPGGAGTPVESGSITLSIDGELTGEAGQGGTQDAADDDNGDMTVDFGFVPDLEPLSIGSTVFLDEDGDGMQDTNEVGVSGVLVEVVDANGNIVGSDITDTNGDYFVDGLDEGTYTVRITTPPDGASTSSPTDGGDDQIDGDDNGLQPGGAGTPIESAPITLTDNGEPTGETEQGGSQDAADDDNGDMTIDFGLVPDPEPVSIGSTVFLDENDNGMQDANEVGIAGVLVEVVNQSGAPIGSSITDTNGDYFVGGLDEGVYFVRIITPPNGASASSTPSNGGDDQVDGDDNGMQSGGAGAPVESGPITLTHDGEPTGETEQGGTQDAADDDNGDMTVDFGFVPDPDPVSIGSTVYLDDNGNGMQDANEVGIAGVLIEVVDANGNVVGSDITDANGDYYIGGLDEGTYTVFISSPPDGAGAVSPVSGGDDQVDGDNNGIQPGGAGAPVESAPITLTHDGEPTGEPEQGGDQDAADDNNGDMTVDFGFLPDLAVSVGSTVFLDEDEDGVQDTNETGIAGVLVEVIDANGTSAGSDVTDANGDYFIGGLTEGTYTVRIANPPTGASLSSPTDAGDDQVDGDDNGSQPGGAGAPVESTPITLTENGEPVDEPAQGGDQDVIDDDNGDMTVDFGFVPDPPDITITKVARPLVASVGDATFDYELIVMNLSASDATSVRVTDPLPLGLTFISDTPAIGGVNADNVYVGVLPSLAGNATTSVFLRVMVTDTDVIDAGLPTNDLTTVALDPVTCSGITTNSPPSTNTLQNTAQVAVPIPFTSNEVIDCDEELLALIGDFVFVDENFNGLQDGEPGVPNFEVQLLAADGTVVATTQTDADGYYEFVVPAGTYQVRFVAPEGTAFTTANVIPGPSDSDANESTGLSGSVTLNEGDINRTIDAGILPPDVTITKVARPLVASVGDATFDYELIVMNLSASDATSVRVTDPLPLGLTFVSDTPAIGGVNADNVYVGVLPSLAGNATTSVFLRVMVTDTDVIDAGLPTNDLTTVALDPVTCSGITTNSPPSTNTLQNTAQVVVPIPFTSNEVIECDEELLALIGDFVFVDENFNGLQDGEPGVPNFEVQLLAADGTVVATTQTDADGYYEFVVPAGTYQVQFVAPEGTAFTTANVIPGPSDSDANESTGLSGSVTLNEGDINRTIDAGILPPDVTITKVARPLVASVGDATFDYELIVMNLSASDATSVRVTDPLPLGLTFVSDTPAIGGVNADNVYVGVLPSLAGNATTSVFLRVMVTDTDVIDAGLPTNDLTTVALDPVTCSGITTNSPPSTNTLQNTAQVVVPIPFTSNEVIECDEELLALIGDFVFVDENFNGLQDGEPGVPNFEVQLLAADGTVVATTQTDADGYYEFVVPAGTYQVQFVAPEGTAFTTANVIPGPSDSDANESTGLSGSVTLNEGDINRTIDAGILPPQVSLTKLVSGAVSSATNETFAYILIVSNTGSADAINAQVMDILPEGIRYLGDNGAGGTENAGVYQNTLALVPANTSTTITLHVEVSNAPSIDLLLPTDDAVIVEVDSIDCTGLNSNSLPSGNALQNNAKISVPIPFSTNVVEDCDEELVTLIGDYVFLDLNSNGIQDAGDLPRAGVTVNLLDATGVTNLATKVTDADGEYEFVVPAGTYIVEFVAPFGLGFTTQDVPGDDTTDSDADSLGRTPAVTVVDGEINRTIDAGLAAADIDVFKSFGSTLASVGGNYTFEYVLTITNVSVSEAINAELIDPLPLGLGYNHDGGAGGTYDAITRTYSHMIASIPANSGATVTLSVSVTNALLIGGSLPVTANYPADPSVSCTNLSSETLSSNTLENVAQVSLTLSGDANRTIDCDNNRLALIGDYAFNDQDLSGAQSAGDTPVADISVDLLEPTGTNVLATTVTDADGLYAFAVVPGTYRVRFNVPLDFEIVAQDLGGDDELDSDADPSTSLVDRGVTPPVTVGEGDVDRSLDVGIFIPNPVSIGSIVFLDEDGDGMQDPDEEGIPGVVVEIVDSNGTVVATDTTDSNGFFFVDGLEEGTYTIRIPTPPPGASSPPPVSGGDDQVDGDNNGIQPGGAGTPVVTDPITLTNGGEPIGETEPGGDQDAADDDNGDMTVDFGFVPNIDPVSIGSTVFSDENDNGLQDAGESGIAGVLVEVLNGSGAVVGSDTTDAAGDYFIEGLPGDTYTVRITTPPGNAPASSTPSNLGDDDVDGDDNGDQPGGSGTPVESGPITLTHDGEPTGEPGQAGDQDSADDNNGNMTVDFGFVPLGSISGTVGEDTNGDNMPDTPLPGVTVELFDDTGTLVDTALTDSNGDYLFTGLPPGDYTVVEQQPAGYDDLAEGDTTPDSSDPTTFPDPVDNMLDVTLTPGEDDDGNSFVEVIPPGTISGNVGEDTDGNNTPDSPLPGVTVELYDGSGTLVDTTTTDPNGDYLFSNLPPGSYTVVEQQPDGYDDLAEGDTTPDSSDPTTFPDPVDNRLSVTLTPGEADTGNSFVEVQPPVQIGDTVYKDLNQNGLPDEDLSIHGIVGIRVHLYRVNPDGSETLVGTETTGAEGRYLFTDIPAGTYRTEVVREDIPDYCDHPTTPVTYTSTSVPGESISDNDYGFIPYGTIGDTVWEDANSNGIPDEDLQTFGLPDVRVNLYLVNPDGSETLVETQITGLEGAYEFNDLPPATYRTEVVRSDIPDNLPNDTTPLTFTTTLVPGQEVTDHDYGFAPDPTAIELESFAAEVVENGVEVRWTTAWEQDTLGFFVYRVAGDGSLHLVNDALVLARGNGDYALEDLGATGGRYVLEEIETDLDRTFQSVIAVATVPAEPVGVPTRTVVAEGGVAVFVTSAENRSYLVTGLEANHQVLDVTDPDSPRQLLGETLGDGSAAYFSAPPGLRIQVAPRAVVETE